MPLGELLIRMGFLNRHDLNIALARKMGYPMVDVKLFPIDAAALTKHSDGHGQTLESDAVVVAGQPDRGGIGGPHPAQNDRGAGVPGAGPGHRHLGDELQIQQKILETYEKFGLHRSVLSEDLPGFSDQDKDQLSSTDLLESMEHGDSSGECLR